MAEKRFSLHVSTNSAKKQTQARCRFSLLYGKFLGTKTDAAARVFPAIILRVLTLTLMHFKNFDV